LEAFEAQLCMRFLFADPDREASDQLADLKQIKSAKAYSFSLKIVALGMTLQVPATGKETREGSSPATEAQRH
jgi:hypothetical protein